MQLKLILIGVIVLIASVLSVASASIGIEAYNQDNMKTFREEKSSNYRYLIGSLVMGILSILASVGIFVLGVKAPPIPFF